MREPGGWSYGCPLYPCVPVAHRLPTVLALLEYVPQPAYVSAKAREWGLPFSASSAKNCCCVVNWRAAVGPCLHAPCALSPGLGGALRSLVRKCKPLRLKSNPKCSKVN